MATNDDRLLNQPVVIDNGSAMIKAGFAGEHIPKCLFRNYIGRPKYVQVMVGALQGDIFVGPQAEEHRGLLSISYPMEHGIVTDWNAMEHIWRFIYGKEQLATYSDDHPVLLTEAALNPRRNREKTAEYFFEDLNVPALFITMPSVLSLYASGRVTGVVLDSGDGVTHAVPICEGYALPHGIMRADIGGRDVSCHLKTLLRKEVFHFRTTAEFEIVHAIKEQLCYVSTCPQKSEIDETQKSVYTLPDGKQLEIDRAKYRAPEVLFRPDLMGVECEGVQEVLQYAIQKSETDLRKRLYENIVISGGSTLFKGFGERLLMEVRKQSVADLKICISAPKERLYTAWMGGSILASVDSFKNMWVSQIEFEEEGQRVVDRKTF